MKAPLWHFFTVRAGTGANPRPRMKGCVAAVTVDFAPLAAAEASSRTGLLALSAASCDAPKRETAEGGGGAHWTLRRLTGPPGGPGPNQHGPRATPGTGQRQQVRRESQEWPPRRQRPRREKYEGGRECTSAPRTVACCADNCSRGAPTPGAIPGSSRRRWRTLHFLRCGGRRYLDAKDLRLFEAGDDMSRRKASD